MHRRVVALALGALFALSAGGDARASTAEGSRVDRQAWARTGAVPTFVANDGELYVSASAGVEETRSYVHVDLSGLDETGARALTLRFHEAGDGLAPDSASINTCALTEPLQSEGELSGEAPEVDCDVLTPATRDANGIWTVPLASYVDGWIAGQNHGVALVPDVSAPGSTFRVALDASMSEVTAPAASDDAPSPVEESPAAPQESPAASSTGEPDGSLSLPPIPAVQPPSTDSAPVTTVVSAAPSRPVAVDHPVRSAVDWPLPLVAASVAAAAGLGFSLSPWRRRVVLPALARRAIPIQLSSDAGLRAAGFASVVALSLLPLLGGEVLVFKSGLVVIFLVAALGLHMLVNWAGELSLAHAGMVGLPAFVVLATSAVTDVSPVYLLPLGVVVGTALGALVGLPTLRAKGVQVALVTLIAGFAIDRFFFTQRWLVGKVPRSVADPTLGPIHFTTSRSEYPLLLAMVALALWAASRLHRSKVGRGWLWIRANPDAAAAFGIPVVGYRVMAYAAAGAFAGLAGGLYANWIQSFSSEAFPTTLSFTYLLLAVLAGPGRIWGVLAAVMLVQGAQVLTSELFGADFGGTLDTIIQYGGPIGLLSVIIQYQSGLSGIGRKAMERVRAAVGAEPIVGQGAPDHGDERTRAPAPVSLAFIGGVVCVAIGFFAIALAWYHAGNTDAVWVQNQEILSGGVGGLGLIILGACLLIRDRLGELIPRPTPGTTSSATARPGTDAPAVIDSTSELSTLLPESPDGTAAPKRTRAPRRPVSSGIGRT